MAIQKIEIVTSAIVVISLVILFILDSAKLISSFIGSTVANTFIYFAICFLYTVQTSTTKWKITIVALSVCLLVVIYANHFYISPWQWEFASRLIYGIDVAAMEAFLLSNWTKDLTSTILFTAFVAEVNLLFQNREESEEFSKIFTIIVSIIIYEILVVFHVKKLWGRRWKKVATASFLFASTMLGIILRIFWHKKDMLFLLIASINACLSLLPWLWLVCVPKIKQWWQFDPEEEMIQWEQYSYQEIAGLPTRFRMKELEIATGNFKALIGEGASGAVFKGTLTDGSTVAVKQIKWQPSGETEFKTEMTIIASRQHVNLVRLLGFCLSSRGDRYLIYPFLENGSLDAWLFADIIKRSHLRWTLRYRIAIDVAKALAYLHHECHHRILHLDIKPANILLNGEFRALLSDFGISKLIGKDESSVMTKARGTVGYLAPEMLVPNAISTKCDVYSYGMVLLELLGGRRNFMWAVDKESQQQQSSYFPKIVREKMLQGNIMEIIDESLTNDEEIKEEEVTVLTRLALWCIQEDPTLRPDMTNVVEILEFRTAVDVPPYSSMFAVNFLDAQPCCLSCQAREVETPPMSANHLSISIQSGR